jgi:hypothetical protein
MGDDYGETRAYRSGGCLDFLESIWMGFKAWPDLLWVLPALVLLKGWGARIFSSLYVIACAFLLRLQVDLLSQIGFPHGLVGLLSAPPLLRGQITYGIFIAVFLLLIFLSPGVNKHIVIALSITFVILAFCLSSVVMVL